MRVLLFALLLAPLAAADEIGFNRDIRPILSNNCFQCHGPDKNTRMADLRLDVREIALERGAIAPGDTAASKLVERILSDDPVLRMPPVYSDETLTDEQKELLVQWIEEGADYEQHWAYLPPERPEAPEGSAAIDFFLERKLAERDLEPVGRADRRTLARRLSLDLTGLPPDLQVVEEFVRDDNLFAYENLIERFLSSSHFGERMAVYWLDLVRYADTTGYHNDVPYNVYPYRDYVIRAFNENKPFDEFTREQLAGDLLPDATPEQIVASAYNRLNRLTTEGGAQPKEYLAKYAADRVRTTATVWLGSTLACAECHDHKFDPFLTKEFYQTAAFFADIEEVGVFPRDGDYGPRIRLLDPEQRAEDERLAARIAELRERDGELDPTEERMRAFQGRLQSIRDSWQPLRPERAWDDCSDPDIEGCDRLELEIAADDALVAQLTGEQAPRESVHVVELRPGAGRYTALLYEALPSDLFQEFHLSELRAELLGRGERPTPIAFGLLEPDFESEEFPLRDVFDGNPHSGWNGEPCIEGVRRALLGFREPLVLREGERIRLTLSYNGRGGQRIAGRSRFSLTGAATPELPPSENLLTADWNSQQLLSAFQKRTSGNPHWERVRDLERQRKTLWDWADECHVTRAVDDPRTMRILPRGNWMDDSGEVVRPQTPEFLGEIAAEGERLTRLDLANWIVSPDNPLTARVFVNRLWALFFGTGVSKILDDVGSQGEPPVHPELLDWLAVEFMESGWDVKYILRTMLRSEAYRRSSGPSAELLAADPFNRLHGRQSAIRLDAEFIRDSALKISGLLNPNMGGPSVKPYQPKGYYGELNFPKREYDPHLDARQFRRGVYMHWQRTFLHPALLAFDAPTREECTAERSVSNTPLQSLTLLNDPSFLEMARALAAEILQADAAGSSERIDWAFRRAFARPPTSEETAALLKLLHRRRDRFEQEPDRARALLSPDVWQAPAELPAVELAAWTSVARALLNKHELLMRY